MVPRCKMCGEPWFGDPGRACNPCVQEHNDRLNGEVTEAILKAERALDEAIRCWEDVEKVETSLTICVKDEDAWARLARLSPFSRLFGADPCTSAPSAGCFPSLACASLGASSTTG